MSIEVNESINYLCIEIIPSKIGDKIDNVSDFVKKGWEMYSPDILIRRHDKKNIKIDLTYLNLNLSSFNLDYDKKKLLLVEGYNQTRDHFNLLYHL